MASDRLSPRAPSRRHGLGSADSVQLRSRRYSPDGRERDPDSGGSHQIHCELSPVRPDSGPCFEERTMNQRLAKIDQAPPAPQPDPAGPRIAFIQSCWHKELVDQCREAFLAESAAHGHGRPQIDLFELPGAFEIPLQAKLLARGGRHAAVVAAALVVDGGIYRHEFVAQAVISGLMQVQLETEVPVISA